jgi:hypothetical protein
MEVMAWKPGEDDMNLVAATVMRGIDHPGRTLPLDWACVAGLIGVLGIIRLHGLNEAGIMAEARKASAAAIDILSKPIGEA